MSTCQTIIHLKTKINGSQATTYFTYLMKKLLTLIAMALLLPIGTYAATKIMGKQVATIDRMYQFVKSKNANFDREIAVQMYKMGEKYGVRGDIALCQSCVETGWFKYTGGTAVTADDHNYCGLGVTQKGKKGCQFSTVAEGCEAQIQHLFAYACKDPLPYAQVDPRFKYVTRGCATTWEALGGKWASSTSYGTNILSIYNQMMNFTVANPTLKASKTSLNFTVEKGKVSSAQNVTITGSNLSSKIVYNAASKMASVSTSGWDEYTGGTMSIKADATGKAAGSYETYVAVQSGSGSDLKRIEIKVYITVTEPASSPALSATPTSLTMSAVRGQSNPTATITVKGTSLTGDISYNSSSSMFAVTTGSGWNARTGGTLTVTMDASKSAGNYSGYIAIAGGGASRVQVNISGTITEPAANPTLTVNPSSLSLSCTEGDANPTGTVTVTASNLTSGLIYDISGNGFTVTPQSGWNGSTGGRLTIALDASKAAGTYNATLIIKGGGVTTRNVALTGTIKAKGTTPDPTPSTELEFKEVWNLSTTAGTATDWSGKIRNFDYCDGYLYAIYNNSEVYVLDARTGQKVGALAKGSVVTGGTLTLCDVRCFEGKIYACNLAGSGKELRIYSWDNKDAQPKLVYSTTDLQGAARLGDCMEIVGTEDDMWIAFCNDDNTTTRIVEFNRKNGSTWVTKCTNATANGARLASSFSSRAYPTGNGYWVDGQGILPTFCNLSGVKQYALTGESVIQGNAWKEFTFGGKKYMLVATYLNKSAASVADGIMRLYDVTDGYDKAKALGDYPTNGLGATRNTSFTGGIEYNVASCQGIEAWVLTTGQGLAYYSSCTSTTDPDPEPEPEPEPGPGKPATLPDKFATDWEYSSTQGTSTSYMNPANVNTRNMVLNGNNLYVLQRSSDNAEIHIVDADTGAKKGTLDNGDIASDTYRYFSVANLSGTIVACNLAFGATSTLKAYAWTGDNAAPVEILSTTNHGARAGDLMCASGTINNGKLYFASNTGYAGKVFVYTVTNGKASATPQVITLKDSSGKDFDLGGGFAVIEIRIDEQGRILASGKGGATALFKADGTHIESMNSAAVGGNNSGSSCQMFGYGDFTLAASVTYATGVKGGRLNLIDATNGLSKAKAIHEYPALSSASGTTNSTFVSTAIARVNGAKVNLWVLIPGQGIAKYTAVSTSGLTSVSDLADGAEALTIALEGRTIRVFGAEKAAVAVYTTTGALVTSATGDAVDASGLAAGIYVVTAVSDDGRRTAARVLVR